MKQYLGLVIGLVVGVLGAVLFTQSLPPEEGSAEERLLETELELRKAQRRLLALDPDGRGSRKGRTVREGMRSIAERIRDGEVVELDDGQQDEMFAVMARSSQRFKAEMEFDGMGGESSRLEGRARDEAIRSMLRPDQVARYDAYRDERRMEAERAMLGLRRALKAVARQAEDEE